MADFARKSLKGNLKKAFKVDHPNLLFLATESNIFEWHVMIVGLPAPYLGGEFIFRLESPTGFPHKPPELRFRTPNGVYMVGGKICISVGEFHAEDHRQKSHGAYGWRAAMGLTGFADQVLNGLICPETLNETKHPDSGQGGLGILDKPPTVRQELSNTSMNYNICHNPALRKQFEELAQANPALKAAQAWAQQNARADILEKLAAGGDMGAATGTLSKHIKQLIGSVLWSAFREWVENIDDENLRLEEILHQVDLGILLELDPSMKRVGLRFILLRYISRNPRWDWATRGCIDQLIAEMRCLAPLLPVLTAKLCNRNKFDDPEDRDRDLDCLRRAILAGASQDFVVLDQMCAELRDTCSREQTKKLREEASKLRKEERLQDTKGSGDSGWGKK